MQANSSPAARRDWRRGMALAQASAWPQAAKAFDRATRAAPNDALYWINLANAHRRAGALPEALAAARRCLVLDASNPLALRLVGDCCLGLHRYAEGAQALGALEAAGHDETDAMLQHASLLHTLCRYDEATAVLLRALSKEPALVRGHAMLGDICRDRGFKREAVECIKTVLALEPGNLEALARLSLEKRHLCDWADFDADLQTLRAILEAQPADRPVLAATFSLLSLPLPPALQLKAAQGDALALCGGVQALPPVLPAQRPGPRIRLGLVSFDFRDHPVAQLLLPVLEQLDCQRFELLLYASGPDDRSPWRERAVRVADHFVELHGLSDAQAAERIRADGVDLLVDLMGHTRGARPGIFARRPAPVQAAYLGFPGSTGMAAIDYIVGDPLVTPLELAAHYSEKLALLPLTMQPNGADRPLPQPMTRAQAGLPEGAFVMCAFNHTYKIGPGAFDVWCSLLRELPHAVLWFRETNPQFHAQLLQAAAERGVAAERIVFAPMVPYADHFSRLALADVFVDTWPYNAHTTASDALWAGVPVVTHYGDSYASRVAASVLNAAGLAELAFATVDDYRCAILALALEPALLASYRQHLNTQRRALPLFDAPRYTRELEALFDRMVSRWRAGLPCEHLAAQSLPDESRAALRSPRRPQAGDPSASVAASPQPCAGGHGARDQRLLVQGWRGISHSFAMANQNQLLAWLRLPGLQVLHQDMSTYSPNWNSREMSAGYTPEDTARLAAIPPPDGGDVDAIYSIAYPTPLPQRTARAAQTRQISFMVTEYGVQTGSIGGPLTELQAFVRDGNAVVTPSAWSRRLIVEFGLPAEHVHVVSLGVQRQTYAPYEPDERRARRQALGFEDGDFVFANVGLASWNKGIDHLLVAFARVHQRHPHARLIIKNNQVMYGARVESVLELLAGTHPGLVDEAVMSAILIVNTNLDQSALRELYACADCYVSPYRAEGFNVPTLEAIACGTPVVVTAGGATDDFCHGPWATRVAGRLCDTPDGVLQGGLCIEVDPDALVQAMQDRLLAPAAERRLSGAAWDHLLDSLSWDRVAKQALEICLPAGWSQPALQTRP